MGGWLVVCVSGIINVRARDDGTLFDKSTNKVLLILSYAVRFSSHSLLVCEPICIPDMILNKTTIFATHTYTRTHLPICCGSVCLTYCQIGNLFVEMITGRQVKLLSDKVLHYYYFSFKAFVLQQLKPNIIIFSIFIVV